MVSNFLKKTKNQNCFKFQIFYRTALSIPLFRIVGHWAMLGITTAMTLLFLFLSLYLRRTAATSSITLNDADFDSRAGDLLLSARNDGDTDSVVDDVTDYFSTAGLEMDEPSSDIEEP
jgi:hypothetical protein